MRRHLWSLAAAVLAVLLTISSAAAQGRQTAVLTGTVTSSDGATVPGATITVTSPALQGPQTAVTDDNGVYVLRGLPPGAYVITAELQGLSTFKREVTVPLGQTVTIDAVLQLAGLSEAVTVAAEAPVVTNPTIGANLAANTINMLPLALRRPVDIALLSPAVNDNTPNVGQLSISGAFAYDNVFLVDGVDVNDNTFGSANNLFVEDGIQETQILTSGISAEYGRFSGGVVNVVTKRGGDAFSGSFRTSLSNPSWQDENPFEETSGITHPDRMGKVYEGTFGGPILRSKIWFFSSGRFEDTLEPLTLSQSGLPYNLGVTNKRGQAKVTGTIWQGHTVSGSYMNNSTEQRDRPGVTSVDLRSIDAVRTQPNTLLVVNWQGVLSSRLFATAQVSRKKQSIEGSGGDSTAIIDSPFRTRGVSSGVPNNLNYNAPFFDALDPTGRDNFQVTGSLSYFLTTPKFGSHDIKGGFERFTATSTGGNSQSSTGYVFYSDYRLGADGKPLVLSNGRLVPQFVPGVSRLYNWLARRGSQTDITTDSLYLHDRFTVGRQWTFDAGLRYENNHGDATGDITVVNTSSLVPRLAATFDLFGNGKWVAQSTYSHYAGKYSDANFGSNADTSNPSLVRYIYTGPAGEGFDFAPGLDPANYGDILDGSFATANVFIEDGLSAPITKEFTASLGGQFTERAHAKLTFVNRSMGRFVEDFTTLDNGKTEVIRDGVNYGLLDNIYYRNTDDLERNYRALILQGGYRPFGSLQLNGNYTLQIRNEGTYEGEARNQPGLTSVYGDFPETLSPRNNPYGRFDDFQEHKVRLWGIYTVDARRFGTIDLSALYGYNSALSFSYFATSVPLSAAQLAAGAQYESIAPGATQTLYYGDRGAGRFNAWKTVDLGVNYAVPILRRFRPYVKLDVLNAFNDESLKGFNTAITPNNAGPRDALGLPLEYVQGPNFGRAQVLADHPLGREFRVLLGFRF
ncbi:MAG TPA: TonB-dependent receptor [Luteitalea sp.]|nr:TonB-dependent receptor [Luteitalea sp.]